MVGEARQQEEEAADNIVSTVESRQRGINASVLVPKLAFFILIQSEMPCLGSGATHKRWGFQLPLIQSRESS